MANKKRQPRERQTKGWLGIFAVMAAALIVLTVCVSTNLFRGWGKSEDPAAEDATGGVVVEGDAGTGISLAAYKIAREEFADYGIMQIADSAQQVKATVTPAGAEDAVLDWSIAFKDPASSWASGKSLSDYVTIAPTSDGALTANVTCKQAFGEQVIITAAIRGNASVKGTGTVDYQQKYNNDIQLSVTYTNTATAANVAAWSLKGTSNVQVAFPGYAKSLTDLTNYYSASGTNKGTYTVTMTTALTTVYTKPATISGVKVEVAPKAAYITVAQGKNGTVGSTAGAFVACGTGTNAASSTITGFDFSKFLMISGNSMDWAGFKRTLKGQASTPMFDVRLTASVNGSAVTKTYGITFDAATFGTFSEGLTIPGIVF